MNAKKRSKTHYLIVLFTLAALILSACATITAAYESCQKNPTGSVTLADGTVVTCAELLAVAPVVVVEPTAQGMTDCSEAEKATTGVGTEDDPIVYPSTWLHDLCWASANSGTGAKFIEVAGPTALQNGEATGPHRMIYVPAGKVFRGWTQGGWRYTTDAALDAQWVVEDLNTGRLGLICGYVKNTRLWAPAYRWDGTKEVRDESLDCPYSLAELLDGTVSATAAPGAATAVITSVSDFSYVMWPEIFKVTYSAHNYCGARQTGVSFPAGVVIVEQYSKHDYDGEYMLDGGNAGLSASTGYCKPSGGKNWTTVLLTPKGFEPATFPLAP